MADTHAAAFHACLREWETNDPRKFVLAKHIDSVLGDVKSILLEVCQKMLSFLPYGFGIEYGDRIDLSMLDSANYNMLVIGMYQHTRNVLLPVLVKLLSVGYVEKLHNANYGYDYGWHKNRIIRPIFRGVRRHPTARHIVHREWPDYTADTQNMHYMTQFFHIVETWSAETVDHASLQQGRPRLLLPFGFEGFDQYASNIYSGKPDVWNRLFHNVLTILQAAFNMENVIFGPSQAESSITLFAWGGLLKTIHSELRDAHTELLANIASILATVERVSEEKRETRHAWDMLQGVQKRKAALRGLPENAAQEGPAPAREHYPLCTTCHSAILPREMQRLVRKWLPIDESDETLDVLALARRRMRLHWHEGVFIDPEITGGGRVPERFRAQEESLVDLYRTLAPWVEENVPHT